MLIGSACRSPRIRRQSLFAIRARRVAISSAFAVSTGQSAGTHALSSIRDLRRLSVAALVSSEKAQAMVTERSNTKAIRIDVRL